MEGMRGVIVGCWLVSDEMEGWTGRVGWTN
jgi:hypothetical protein